MQGKRLLLWCLQFYCKWQFLTYLDSTLEVFGCLSSRQHGAEHCIEDLVPVTGGKISG